MECIVSFIALILDKVCDIIFTLSSLANLFTVIGLPLTAYAIYYAKKAFEKQNEALELQKKDSDEQKILGAWSLLAQKGTGDLGRKDALEFLHKQGKSLAGLDLTGAYLFGLRLKGDLGGQVPGQAFIILNLESAIFNNADLRWANFEGAYLSFAKFNRALLSHTTFNGANLTGADFTNALLIEYALFRECYALFNSGDIERSFPTAPEGWKFELEIKEDGNPRFEAFNLGTPVEQIRTYIKLIKAETKNP